MILDPKIKTICVVKFIFTPDKCISTKTLSILNFDRSLPVLLDYIPTGKVTFQISFESVFVSLTASPAELLTFMVLWIVEPSHTGSVTWSCVWF